MVRFTRYCCCAHRVIRSAGWPNRAGSRVQKPLPTTNWGLNAVCDRIEVIGGAEADISIKSRSKARHCRVASLRSIKWKRRRAGHGRRHRSIRYVTTASTPGFAWNALREAFCGEQAG